VNGTVKGMAAYEGGRVPRVVVGSAGSESVAGFATERGASAAVLIVDESAVANGYVDTIVTALAGSLARSRHVERCVVPPAEPDSSSVDAAAELVRSTPGAIVIGVGGGSALDTAKQAAVVATASMGVDHYALGANPLPGHIPMVAIPTTSGTGSEVTRTCIVTDRDGRKVWTWGDELLPDLVVLDPVSTVTMPSHVTAATGLDAFVHAIEAVSGRRSTALVTAPALHALRLVIDHLPIAVTRPDDLDARQAMQEAAFLAGLAIDGGGTGIAHSIGHALGTLAHVPHGVAVAIGLAAALDWNVDGVPEAYATAAGALGRPVGELPHLLDELLSAVEFTAAIRRLPELELEPGQLAAAMVVDENLPMYRNNCRLADDAERRQLAGRALSLWSELWSARP
jgi:alcohol dehydrogenase class IV